jgi:UDP-glucose 4-epimerase
VVVGRESNLSRRLAALLPDTVLVSARGLASVDVRTVLPEGPFVLVLNQFQPATALTDLRSPEGYLELALRTTARLLEALPDLDCRKVLYTSSAAVYGDDVACREEAVPRITTLHASLKISNEYLVRDVCRSHGVDHTVVRLFNLYGGDDRFSIVARILAAVREGRPLTIANHGNAVRDFIHLDDVAASYQALLGRSGLPVVNVATGQGVSVRGLVDAVRMRGHRIDTTSVPREEIRISTADVTRLAQIIDVDAFVGVLDHVLAELG